MCALNFTDILNEEREEYKEENQEYHQGKFQKEISEKDVELELLTRMNGKETGPRGIHL